MTGISVRGRRQFTGDRQPPRPSQVNRRVREIRGTAALRAATRAYDHRIKVCLAWKAVFAVLLGLVIVATKPNWRASDLTDRVGSVAVGVLLAAIVVLVFVVFLNQVRAIKVIRREAIRQLTTLAG